MTAIIALDNFCSVDGFHSTKQKVIRHRFTTNGRRIGEKERESQTARDWRQKEGTNYERTRGKCRVEITFLVSWRHHIKSIWCLRAETTKIWWDALHLYFSTLLRRFSFWPLWCVGPYIVWMWNRNATTIDATTCGLVSTDFYGTSSSSGLTSSSSFSRNSMFSRNLITVCILFVRLSLGVWHVAAFSTGVRSHLKISMRNGN